MDIHTDHHAPPPLTEKKDPLPPYDEQGDLTDEERYALKAYVDQGGTLLVDAYAGSDAFADSARKQLADLFGEPEKLSATSLLATGRFIGGADLSNGIKYKLAARRDLRDRETEGVPLGVRDLLGAERFFVGGRTGKRWRRETRLEAAAVVGNRIVQSGP